MSTHDLHAWLEWYRRAWETCDPDAAAALFSDDATYFETPFGPPACGKDGVRAYWAQATEHHRNVTFSHEIVSMIGQTGVARWQAEYTKANSGVRSRLDGIFLLEFDEAGLCRVLREWWHRTEMKPTLPPSPGA